ncbi:Uncharacterised protein [uncultured archaeon]|nr:Uncharacterised protein [uncultured archaeon]
MKKKTSSKKMSLDACPSCGEAYCECCPTPHPYGRGKALFAVAIGILLILFGFQYITIQVLALVLGVLYILKGSLRLMGNW